MWLAPCWNFFYLFELHWCSYESIIYTARILYIAEFRSNSNHSPVGTLFYTNDYQMMLLISTALVLLLYFQEAIYWVEIFDPHLSFTYSNINTDTIKIAFISVLRIEYGLSSHFHIFKPLRNMISSCLVY